MYYEGETTAKGEGASEWGAYKHRLAEVIAVAYNPATKAMAKTPVAKYEYDGQGRLRAEWNPAISPALKTTYGYDGEGHVTALSPPGQEPWLFTYGTIAGDPSTGRLLKAARAPASTPLWKGALPAEKTLPAVSGSPVVGIRMAVSNGSWSNEPVAYSYQWERCSPSGENCTAILGATNANYTPQPGDVGNSLRVRVSALNGGGAVSATSYRTEPVIASSEHWEQGEYHAPQPGSAIEYQVPLSGGTGLGAMTATEVAKWGQKDDPVEGAAASIFPPSKPMGWPATEYTGATTYYMDSHARTVNVAAPTGGISTSEYNEDNDVIRALSAENRATALSEPNPVEAAELLSTKSSYSAAEVEQTWGPQHKVKLVVGKSGGSEEVLARSHVEYFYDEGAKEVEEKTHESYELATKTIDDAETASKEEFDKRTAITSYSGQNDLGWKLRKPTSETTEPGGLNLTTTTIYQEATGEVEETQPPAAAGKDASVPPVYSAQFGSAGSGTGEMSEPKAVAIGSGGIVYVLDTGNSRIEEFTAEGAYVATFGSVGTGNGELEHPTAMAVGLKGELFVADTGNNRVEEFNAAHEYVRQFGHEGSEAGDVKEPRGIAVGPKGDVFVSDTGNNRVDQFEPKGGFVRAFGYGVSNGEAKLEICTTSCKAGVSGSGNGQLHAPRGIVLAENGDIWVADDANSRIQEFTGTGEFLAKTGAYGTKPGQFEEPTGITISPHGEIWVSDAATDRLQEFTATGTYIASIGTKGSAGGQFEEPGGIEIAAAGTMYVADVKGDHIERWIPAISGEPGAHDTRTVYYTAGTEAEEKACRSHPEWVGLPCMTKPAAEPGVSGLPTLPVTTTTYNMWNQAETVEEAFGPTTRTKKTTFDAAGRPLKTEVKGAGSGNVDTAVPQVTDKYNETNGALETQSTTVGEKTQTITSHENTVGELETYTDADGNTTHFKYNEDRQVTEVSDGSEEGKGKQTYSYNEATGERTGLTDSSAGAFGATYNVGGEMTSESYPNGMTAYITHNSVGAATGIEYKKLTNCTKNCVWFSDTLILSIHGETLEQTSTLSGESYTYDNAGRLTEAQETPAGESCRARIYAYDEEANRTSETTRECASETGTTELHTYDTDNRLTDAGIAYEVFGDTTKLPAGDAGGSELTSSYYVDGQVDQQSQAGESIEYRLDPEDRTRETISSGNTAATVIQHYDGPGSTVAWTSEPATGKWTRNIPGISGELAAIETNTHAAVLQLHDLQGDIVATASLSGTETKLLSTYNSTEFGVPSGKTAPPTYAWLGAAGLSSQLPSGTITQDGATYVPQTGRQLQTQPCDLPAPSNSIPAFTDAAPSGAAEDAAAAASIQETQYLEAKHAEEAANHPAGEVPEPAEEVDPEILSAQGALKLKGEFEAEAILIDSQLVGGGCIYNAECELTLETDAEILGQASELLEGCYGAVHDGRWHDGYYQTGVCYVHYTHFEDWGHTIIKKFETEACWSPPKSEGITLAWDCPRHGSQGFG